jgi:SAM-dependent methyltransferase
MEQTESQDRVGYELRTCPQCGSSISKVKFTGRDNMMGIEGLFYVSECNQCGLLFQNPSLKSEFLRKHYPDDYAPYSAGEVTIGRTVLWFLKNRKGYNHLSEQPPINWPKQLWGKWSSGMQLFPDYVPNGRLLEVACASGNRLELLRKFEWSECLGIEYSEYAAQIARERGFVVYSGRVEDTLREIPDNSLDVIIASFVMEHLDNPFSVTNQLSEKLKPGGQFIFSTLNINSPDFWLWRENWYDLDLPRHYTFFRKRDLYQMLEKNFQIDNIYYQPAPNDYVGSARYWLRNSPSNALLASLNKLIVALGDKINLACLLLSALGQATRITIHARKK